MAHASVAVRGLLAAEPLSGLGRRHGCRCSVVLRLSATGIVSPGSDWHHVSALMECPVNRLLRVCGALPAVYKAHSLSSAFAAAEAAAGRASRRGGPNTAAALPVNEISLSRRAVRAPALPDNHALLPGRLCLTPAIWPRPCGGKGTMARTAWVRHMACLPPVELPVLCTGRCATGASDSDDNFSAPPCIGRSHRLQSRSIARSSDSNMSRSV